MSKSLKTGPPPGAGFYQHPAAIVESSCIGPGTRVWAFAHIMPGARVGSGCNICDHTFIEGDAVVGDRVTIKSGVQIWDGITLEDDVFVGPNATFTNDRFPRSRRPRGAIPRTLVRRGASIGANATILPGLTIGERAMVGAGAVVARDVPAEAVVVGNPARIAGYAGDTKPAEEAQPGPEPSRVRGAALYRMPRVEDLSGELSFGDAERHIPFAIGHYSLVSNSHIRREDACRTQRRLLICVAGSCTCTVDDSTARRPYLLDSPTLALYVPPLHWCVVRGDSPASTLLVLASGPYDPADSIRSYAEFLEAPRDGFPVADVR